eukprot:jgi/Galph1/1123/GphlegSOOS_G5813.1
MNQKDNESLSFWESSGQTLVVPVSYKSSFRSTTLHLEEERPLIFDGLSHSYEQRIVVDKRTYGTRCQEEGTYRWPFIILILCLNYLIAFLVYFGRLLQSDMTYIFLFRPQWLGIFFGLCPLAACLLTLGHEKAVKKFERLLGESTELWPVLCVSIFFALLGAVSFNVSGGLEGSINVFSIIVLVCALGSLHQPQLRSVVGLTWTDATAWILMWIILDSHWNEDLFFGRQVFVYDFWSLMFSNLSIVGWKIFRKLPGLNFRLFPVQFGDIMVAISCAMGLGLFIPMAVFLHYVPPVAWDRLKLIIEGSLTIKHVVAVSLVFLHLLFTVALVEEILFRGILLAGLDGNYPNHSFLTLIVSSILFGLSHWSHEHQLGTRLLTCTVDSLGVFLQVRTALKN